jgi:hypothetical protein
VCGLGEAEVANERGIDVVQHVGPNFADVWWAINQPDEKYEKETETYCALH